VPFSDVCGAQNASPFKFCGKSTDRQVGRKSEFYHDAIPYNTRFRIKHILVFSHDSTVKSVSCDSYGTARSELRKEGSVFGAVSLFLLVYKMYREPLNAFAPNLHGRGA